MSDPPSTVTIAVRYLGQLRHRMGCASEELTLVRPATVRRILERLVATHGSAVADFFFNQYGWLDPRLFFLVDDGGRTYREQDLDRELSGGERITMFLGMPMAGG